MNKYSFSFESEVKYSESDIDNLLANFVEALHDFDEDADGNTADLSFAKEGEPSVDAIQKLLDSGTYTLMVTDGDGNLLAEVDGKLS